MSFHHVNCTTQFGVISKLAEGALDSIVDVIDKDVKEHRSQDRPQEDTARYWPPPGHGTVDRHPLSVSFQPISYPTSGPPIKSTSLQFGDKDVVGDYVKGLDQVQVNDIGNDVIGNDIGTLSLYLEASSSRCLDRLLSFLTIAYS